MKILKKIIEYNFILLFFCDLLYSAQFCEIKNILRLNDVNIQCKDNDLLFGEFSFFSEKVKKKYLLNKKYNLKVLSDYEKEIIKYIGKYCHEKNNIKVKDIINYNRSMNKYHTKVIISCRFKNEQL